MRSRGTKRRRSRRFIVVRLWRWMATFLVVCLFGWLALPHSSKIAVWQRAFSDSESGRKAFINHPPEAKGVLALEANRKQPVRVVYPYSVISGGVRSMDELKNAIASDPVVSREYASFDLSSARIIRLDRDRSMHVSYRLGSQVYWTKKKLKLEKGETLITDGVNTARTRCGNLISETVSEPVVPNEPTAQEMDTPLNPQDTGIQTASNDPPDPPVTEIPGINLPPVEEAPPPPPVENDPAILLPPGPPGLPAWPASLPPAHVVSVPEPRTPVLLLIGLIAVVLLRWRGVYRSRQRVG
jgi:hypothetical protein